MHPSFFRLSYFQTTTHGIQLHANAESFNGVAVCRLGIETVCRVAAGVKSTGNDRGVNRSRCTSSSYGLIEPQIVNADYLRDNRRMCVGGCQTFNMTEFGGATGATRYWPNVKKN